MRELSLFSGAGGGLLGTKLLGWKHCGYVEYDDYCQRIIAQRIEDGILDRAPIFGDIRAFIAEGYAEAYQGMVDVVTAGFPCQPFSVAGKREGADDNRNMWPQTIDVVRRVRPRFALLENVPGLLAHEYSQQIFRDLAESGYSARWRVLSAAECGAPHKRDRVWIVADDERNELRQQSGGQRRQNGTGKAQFTEHGAQWNSPNVCNSWELQQTQDQQKKRRWISDGTWWSVEPDVGRLVYGASDVVDRTKALGNAQVPIVVATAWELLNRE